MGLFHVVKSLLKFPIILLNTLNTTLAFSKSLFLNRKRPTVIFLVCLDVISLAQEGYTEINWLGSH